MLKTFNTPVRFFSLLLLLGMMAVTTGCKQEGCTDPLSTNYDPDAKEDDGTCVYPTVGALEFHMHSKVGATHLAFGDEYTHANGRKYTLNVARFYISNLRLVSASGEIALADTYLQANGAVEEYDVSTNVPEGTYTGIKFDVGVDDAANTSDPASYAAGHVLAASSPTFDHWSWNTGYKFIRIEGMADTSATMTGTVDGPIVYHIGLATNRREVNIAHPFTVSYAAAASVHLAIDWGQFLANLDFSTEITTHTMNDPILATKIADEAPLAVTAQ